jgi:CHASE3 domain sensor protein
MADGVASYRAMQTVLRNEGRFAHSGLVLRELGATLSSAEDAESGQRGYLLTSRPAYLRPYTAARSSGSGSTSGASASSPRTTPSTAAHASGRTERQPEARRVARNDRGEKDAHESAAATAIVLSDRGKNLMDALRANGRESNQSAARSRVRGKRSARARHAARQHVAGHGRSDHHVSADRSLRAGRARRAVCAPKQHSTRSRRRERKRRASLGPRTSSSPRSRTSFARHSPRSWDGPAFSATAATRRRSPWPRNASLRVHDRSSS